MGNECRAATRAGMGGNAMVRWMCGILSRERKTNELRKMVGIESVMDIVKRNRLRWLGHMLRKDESDWVRRVMEINVDGSRERRRPRKNMAKGSGRRNAGKGVNHWRCRK